MVIVQLSGGLGNQLFQYAFGRLLAYKLKTQLKLIKGIGDAIPENVYAHNKYALGCLNIQENFATKEEIDYVTKNGVTISPPAPDLNSIQGDVLLKGHLMHHIPYYADVHNILREEFTLKTPWHKNAAYYKDKILSAECSVSMHFRRGDYVYNQRNATSRWAKTIPYDYYYTCINILKQEYDNLHVFVFSNDIDGVKKDIHLDVPTEFVKDCETDIEEFFLMSLCKYNIIINSTFSLWASWLNKNPGKKVFRPKLSNAEEVRSFLNSLNSEKKKALINSGRIVVPYDFDTQPEVTVQPYFSFLLVVNNNHVPPPISVCDARQPPQSRL